MSLSIRAALFASIVSVALAAEPASAKNICLSTPEGANVFVFEAVKKPSVGKSVPLRGIFYDPVGIVAPFDGSATMRPNKDVMAGIFVHAMAMVDSHNFTMQWITTPALAGDARYDSDGDFRSDGTLSLYVIDCKRVAVP